MEALGSPELTVNAICLEANELQIPLPMNSNYCPAMSVIKTCLPDEQHRPVRVLGSFPAKGV